MKDITEIRVKLDSPESRENAKKLTILSAIKGEPMEKLLTESVKRFLARPENARELERGTWLLQEDLIVALREKYNLQVSVQTLIVNRKEGRFDGTYHAEAGGRVFYLLEAVAPILQIPRPRKNAKNPPAIEAA